MVIKNQLKKISTSTNSSQSMSSINLSEILKLFKSRNEALLKQKIGKNTYLFLHEYQRKLLNDGLLIKDNLTFFASSRTFRYLLNDFSVVVFPSAKAFEGYIKKIFLNIKLITKKEIEKDPYQSIGKIINGEKIKNKIIDKKRDRSFLKLLSAQWDLCRNVILHYDIDQPEIINSKEEAFRKVENIYEVMKKAYKAFIGDPDNVEVIKKSLTSEELQSQIDILLATLSNLQKDLNSLTKKKT